MNQPQILLIWIVPGILVIQAINIKTTTKAVPISDPENNEKNNSATTAKSHDFLDEPAEITRYRIQACANCKQYEDNHCSTVAVAELKVIGCPETGAEACQICQELQGIRQIQNADIDEGEWSESEGRHHVVKRSCLPYGADCSSGYCCRNVGLKCVTNSEGRGRNHNFCRYHDGI